MAPLTVPLISLQVAAEGAARIVVVTDEPEKYASVTNLAPGAQVRHRDELDAIQRELREVKGLSVLIYDQTCAAEKRRRRKRGTYPDPPKRAFINAMVCEGCGDCSRVSNCISVKPLETELGRKRQIDQSDCNKDFSCLKGFCPSFVTVHGGKPRRRSARDAVDRLIGGVPNPVIPDLTQPYNILVTGIGGTGVITVGALLGMAAHLQGRGATVLDFTGLAQKNGGVTSHVRLGPDQGSLDAVRIGVGATDLLLACDLIVAASRSVITRLDPKRSVAVVSDRITPTAEFVRNTTIDLSAAGERRALRARITPGSDFIDAPGMAVALMGDSIASNLIMLGFAWQKGRIPLSFEAIDRAIELNGVAVKANRQAFALGRTAAHDPAAVSAAMQGPGEQAQTTFDLAEFVSRRSEDLRVYQDVAYADRYRKLVLLAETAERELSSVSGPFTEAVARFFYKLMAYKDEYEVARLYTDGRFEAEVRNTFEGDYRLQFHLAPPLFARRDPVSGELKKRSYGPWMMQAFRLLARLKGLRGTPFDLFGYQADRRIERALVDDYETLVRQLTSELTAVNLADAVAQARFPDAVRGFGHIKGRSLEALEGEKTIPVVDQNSPADLIAAE